MTEELSAGCERPVSGPVAEATPDPKPENEIVYDKNCHESSK